MTFVSWGWDMAISVPVVVAAGGGSGTAGAAQGARLKPEVHMQPRHEKRIGRHGVIIEVVSD
ncbi:hypothetical protein GCM10009780_19490 [Actinomadura alba]